MLCDASRNACSRTSISMPGCSGNTTISPGASRENATRPGPWAREMLNGIPPMVRFKPPPVCICDSGAASSFHSRTWCSK